LQEGARARHLDVYRAESPRWIEHAERVADPSFSPVQPFFLIRHSIAMLSRPRAAAQALSTGGLRLRRRPRAGEADCPIAADGRCAAPGAEARPCRQCAEPAAHSARDSWDCPPPLRWPA